MKKKKTMTQSRSVNCSNHRMPRNSLNYRDNYRKAHRKARKSAAAASSRKKTAWHAASSVNVRPWTNSTVS